MSKHKHDAAEEAAINAGIAGDPDTVELGDALFENAKPAAEVLPEIVEAYRRSRGKQKAPTKMLVSLRLSRDVLDYYRSSGPGWQARIDAALREQIRQGNEG